MLVKSLPRRAQQFAVPITANGGYKIQSQLFLRLPFSGNRLQGLLFHAPSSSSDCC